MTPPESAPATPRSELAWRIVGLANLYRLLVVAVLLAVHRFTLPVPVFGAQRPALFLLALGVYGALGVLLAAAGRRYWPSRVALVFGHVLVDSLAVAVLLYASGGASSGLAILLVIPVLAMTLLADGREPLLIAAIAALAILAQQIAAQLAGIASLADYPLAGVMGAVVFLVALATWPVAARLGESEALVRRQEIDLANLAQLSQYIVQHLRESILVVDPEDRIRLINESAAEVLGDDRAFPGALLGEASPRLLYLLATWRSRESLNDEPGGTFVAADGARVIEPHFAQLGGARPAPVLVFLEDTAALAGRVQQSKLAALGRLSASIAHEIRNPVGAMSHAAQLLAESPALADADRRLVEIVKRNGGRVNEIIENVLSLSRRESSRPERIALQPWLEAFREEFCATMQWPAARLRLTSSDITALEVQADPSHLRQILWNLCENAIKYGVREQPQASIELRQGRLKPSLRPFLEVIDPGPGIEPGLAERIFEPFVTGSERGSGLGLFLARELAQTNGATLLYERPAAGGSVFRLVFSDPQRWTL